MMPSPMHATESSIDTHRDRVAFQLEHGFDIAYFNLSEFLKNGALLSCMVMHLNRQSYDISLTS